MAELLLAAGHIALVDDVDFELIAPYKWHRRTGWSTSYVGTAIKLPTGRFGTLYLHRLITNAQPGEVVDHRNHDGLDNRRVNLRLCSATQNNGNMRRPVTNTSGYKGVNWVPSRGYWRAEIHKCRRKHFLGSFSNPEDAARAYNTAALELFGEFALLNEVSDA
jgi:hypothetical protein